ncbi:MAG: hypothetical protein PHO46_04990 [Thermoguttaceae bacterium]|nr:hypothetical protein [Thermoguttaceae bacterium]
MIEQVVVAIQMDEEHNDVAWQQSTSGAACGDVVAIVEYAACVELIDGVYDSNNFFCLNLPSGSFAIGRLTPQEFVGGNQAKRYYFESMIVDDETFYRCGANPKTLISSAINSTFFAHYRPDRTLRPFEIEGRTELLRYNELLETSQKVGDKAIIILVQSVLENNQTFFVTDSLTTALVSCVYSLLPVCSRKNLTVAAGLHFRDDCMTRLCGVTKGANVPLISEECRKTDSFLDLCDVRINGNSYVVDNPWAMLVQAILVSEYVRFFFYEKLIKEVVGQDNDFGDDNITPLSFDVVTKMGIDWLNELDNESDEDDSIFGSKSLDFDLNGENGEGEEWKRYANDRPLNASGDDRRLGASIWDDAEEIELARQNRFLDDMKDFSAQIEEDLARQVNQAAQKSKNEKGEKASAQPDSLNTVGTNDESDERRLARNIQEIDDWFACSDGVAVGEADSSKGENNEIKLSPFALLSSAFPSKDRDLRTLHTLIEKVVKEDGQMADVEELERFWRQFAPKCQINELHKIRFTYLESLIKAIGHLEVLTTEEHVKTILACYEVISIITKNYEEDASDVERQ